MSVYKIPQDVEADDKFVGPLSFKQFIFVGIAVISSYITFLSLTRGFWPMTIITLPIIIIFGFLGFPWGRDQPTEIWLAARIRFFIKPRVRIWNQSGVKELVTITAPKTIERHYTDGLSQNEVSSRLTSLASLLDSRGWAVKNATTGVYDSPLLGDASNDRLLDMTALPQEVSDITTSNDVLDEASNSTALHFEELIKNSEQKHRQEAMDKLQAARTAVARTQSPPTQQTSQAQPADFWYLQQGSAAQPATTPLPATQQPPQAQNDFWFLNGGGQTQQTPVAAQAQQQPAAPQAPPEPAYATFQAPSVVAPHQAAAPALQAAPAVSPEEERAILEKIHRNQEQEQHVAQYGHLKTIQPLGVAQEQPTQQTQPAPPAQAPQSAVTAPVNPDIIKLATNDDLNVATIAREAHKSQESSDGEIVISLR